MRKKGISAPKGFYHFMVNKFLRNVDDFTKGKWAKEIKLSKKLFNSYPDVRFWNQLELDFKLNSLAWLLSEEGKYTLKIRGKMMKYSPAKVKEYKLQKRKIGRSKYITKTRKTLIEILNESKKN
jgi:hypothetical protein